MTLPDLSMGTNAVSLSGPTQQMFDAPPGAYRSPRPPILASVPSHELTSISWSVLQSARFGSRVHRHSPLVLLLLFGLVCPGLLLGGNPGHDLIHGDARLFEATMEIGQMLVGPVLGLARIAFDNGLQDLLMRAEVSGRGG